jgi:hypothetical protein
VPSHPVASGGDEELRLEFLDAVRKVVRYKNISCSRGKPPDCLTACHAAREHSAAVISVSWPAVSPLF